jgi:hypothetical protein
MLIENEGRDSPQKQASGRRGKRRERRERKEQGENRKGKIEN